MRMYKIRDKQVWGIMVKAFVTLMNTRSISQQELVEATINFHLMKVSSQKLFEFIIKYHIVMGFNERTLETANKDRVVMFFESIGKWYYTIDSKEFQGQMMAYIVNNIDRFSQ